MEFTEEQNAAIERIMKNVEDSKRETMKCLLCEEPTFDRGLVCVGPAPASTIMYGLCYVCKNLPYFEEEVVKQVRAYIISIGRTDLLKEN